MFSRRFSFANQRSRRAIALLALFAVCAAAVPVPLGIIYRNAKDLSQPFPCQKGSCGCKNAEQCWTNCCCLTPSERLTWAKENGVTPPSYAAKVRDEGASQVASQKAKPTTCTKCAVANTKPSCCSSKPAAPVCGESCESEEVDCETTLVLSIMALKCKGAANLFTNLPWAILPPSVNESWTIELLSRYSPINSPVPLRVFLIPDVPPPRLCS